MTRRPRRQSEAQPSATLSLRDPNVIFSAALVALTVLGLLTGWGGLKLVVALVCLLTALRALWGVWTLLLVRRGQHLEHVQRRLGMYSVGALAVACSVALLLSLRH